MRKLRLRGYGEHLPGLGAAFPDSRVPHPLGLDER